MTKVFECRHGGVVCDARITGDSEEEVVGKAVDHARREHGVDLASSTTLANYARSLVRDEDEDDRPQPPPEAA